MSALRRQLPWLLLLLAGGAALWAFSDATGPGDPHGIPGLEDDAGDEDGTATPAGGNAGVDAAVSALPRLIGLDRPGPAGAGRGTAAGRRGAGAPGAAGIGGAGKRALVACGGRVTGPGGRPAADVALRFLGDWGGILVATTDERGRFATTLPAGRYGVLVRAEGYGGLRLAGLVVDGATGTDLDLQLEKAVRIDVTVRRDGTGIAGAAVALQPDDGAPGDPETGTTDALGQAAFPAVVAGTYRLEVQLADAEVLTRKVEAKRDQTFTFDLPRGVEIRGRVAAKDDDRPIAGAEVTAVVRGPQGAWLASRTTTDDAGLFQLEVARGSVARFEVVAPGWVPWPDRRQLRTALRKLAGIPAGVAAEIEVALESGLTLEGRVSDPSGKPVPGLELRFVPRRGAALAALTDEEGDYEVRGAEPQRYDVVVRTEGWFGPRGQSLLVPASAAGGRFPFDLEVAPTLTVTGRVVRPDGGAAAGARVWATGGGRVLRAANDQGRDLETFTDGAGRWRLDDLPANLRLTLRASLGALEARPRGLDTANLPDGPIRLVLAATTALRGTVVDRGDGRPVAGAHVEVRPRGTPGGRSPRTLTTEEDGTFAVDDLIPGTWELQPSKSGYLPAAATSLDLQADEGERSVRLELDPGLRIVGRVLAESGVALGGALVVLVGEDRDGRTVARRERTQLDGTFRIGGLVDGTYRLTVRQRGYRMAKQDGLRGGEDRLVVTLKASP